MSSTHDARFEKLADLIQDTDAATMNHENAAQAPAASFCAGVEQRQQRGDLRRDGGNGEAVANGDLKIGGAGATLLHGGARGIVEVAAQIGAQEIFLLGSCSRAAFQQFPLLDEGLAESGCKVEFRLHGVACGGVGLAQFDLHFRAIGSCQLCPPADAPECARESCAEIRCSSGETIDCSGSLDDWRTSFERGFESLQQAVARPVIEQSGFAVAIDAGRFKPGERIPARA